MAAAAAALAAEVDSDELRKDLVEQAASESENLADTHPNHTNLARDRLQTLFTLSQIDEKYTPEVILAGKKLAELAPTDASIQYNLALIYMLSDKNEEALKQIEKVLQLKPDYQDAKDLQSRLRSG
jgi:tetratricopeptide (TPR) repeat protein